MLRYLSDAACLKDVPTIVNRISVRDMISPTHREGEKKKFLLKTFGPFSTLRNSTATIS